MEAKETKIAARVAADVTVTDTLAVARNAATNGRLFCVMLFVACLTVFAVRDDGVFAALAIFAAAPVGLAYLVDPLPAGPLKSAAQWAMAALPLFVILIFMIR